MYDSHIDELEDLVAAIADGGASEERVAALQQLLLDDPQLQDHYASLVGLHMLLHSQLKVSADDEQVLPMVGESAARQTDSKRPGASLSQHIDRNVTSFHPSRYRWATVATLAACLTVAFWLGRVSQQGEHHTVNPPSQLIAKGPRVRQKGHELLVDNTESLQIVGNLTRDAGLTSLLLPRCSCAAPNELTLCSGNAWYERPARKTERGYLLELGPGEHMDVYFDTDAMGRNTVAIVELSNSGLVIGNAMQFNNLPSGISKAQLSRAGSVGEFSEHNNTPVAKYFLFTGSHMLYDGAAGEVWRQSDFRVQLDKEDLLVLGWDDSGYSGYIRSGKHDSPADSDFNDIRAMIRLERSDDQFDEPTEPLVYHPAPEEPADHVAEAPDGHIIEVGPGEKLVLAAYSDAVWQNSVRIIELSTKRILWSHDGEPPREGIRQTRNRGVFLISNNGSSVEQYLIEGRHHRGSGPDTDEWIANDHQVLTSDGKSMVIGFNDSKAVRPVEDWDDLRIFARWFRD